MEVPVIIGEAVPLEARSVDLAAVEVVVVGVEAQVLVDMERAIVVILATIIVAINREFRTRTSIGSIPKN